MPTARLPSWKKHGTLIGLLVIVATTSILSPKFLTADNLLNIVRQTSIHGIMAVGMTFVILTAGIDLSVGSMAALAGLLCASLVHAGLPVVLVVAVTLLAGCLMGLVNGAIITLGRVTPFVVTLGTMSIARGLAHISTGGEPISGFGEGFRFLGKGEVPTAIFLLSVLAAAVVLKRTRLGRYTYAIGGNAQAARLSGIRVRFYTAAAYVICGLTSALSAVVLTARLNAAESLAGKDYELDVIASVVIGGTSLMGGRGSVWGTLLGALLIGTINNAMSLLNMNLLKLSSFSYYELVFKGVIIVAAVLLDRLGRE
jgi:ribose/xylose/arabinose/galactoside ABC-type transport system permease subunit